MLGRKLHKGDTIGIVAPAGIGKSDRIEKGIDKLKSLGFNVRLGKHVYDKWGYFAGEDKHRAEDIMGMFEDDKVNMILCVRGGYGAARLFPYLNFNKIKKHPKIFMGYSDITILLNAFYDKTDLITFHGPMLGDLDNEDTLSSIILTLCEGDKKYEIKNPESISMLSNTDRYAEGRIAGGNLTLICSTLGTPYEIDTRNKILFIEEVEEPPYKIDRMLAQLAMANKLQQCEGFILGHFTDCVDEDKESFFTLNQVLEQYIMSLNKPTLVNFMAGHDSPKLVLPIGAKARINGKNRLVEIMEPVVK
ncbi:LD-carboxypeptidase [Clostridiales bacterium oral taxon 876 str. F0540]|nr:LD-carboxypeptidase [Clostridiales bacterium oral taxon 876 str. F0540]